MRNSDADKRIEEYFHNEKLNGRCGSLEKHIDFLNGRIVERDYLALNDLYEKYKMNFEKKEGDEIVDHVVGMALSDGIRDVYSNFIDFLSSINSRGVDIQDGRVVKVDVSSIGRFSKIPKSIGYLNDLRELRYMGSSLHGSNDPFYSNFSNLENLEKIFLYRFDVGEFPSAIAKLPSLKHFFIQDGKMDGISDEVSRSSSLEHLAAFGCSDYSDVFKISKEIGRVKNLKRLSMDSMLIEKLPEEILEAPKLEVVSFHFCDFDDEEESYRILEELKKKGVRVV